MFEQDYIKRMIQQLARLVARLAGLRDAGRHEEALDLLERSLADLTGVDAVLLARLDPTTVSHMLSPDQLLAYLTLARQRADLLDTTGRAADAAVQLRRAQAVAEAWLAQGGRLSDELRQALAAIGQGLSPPR